MESFRPYVWLRKQNSQYNTFFCISLPSGFRVSGGLQSPTDNTTTGIRTYKFNIEANLPSAPSIVDSNVGNHSQPASISKIEFQVIDTTDSGRPEEKGFTDTNYQDADDLA